MVTVTYDANQRRELSPIAHPYHHAVSSVKKWGGVPEDYQPIHDWFDETKALLADFRHRALRHHAEGIFLCEQVFGTTITLSTCTRCGNTETEHPWLADYGSRGCLEFKPKHIPVRWIGEQHVTEDMGFIPDAAMWLKRIAGEPWMFRGAKPLSQISEMEEKAEFMDSKGLS